MYKQIKIMAVSLIALVTLTACNKKSEDVEQPKKSIKVENKSSNQENKMTQESLDKLVYDGKEETPTQEIIDPANSTPATDVMTTDKAEKQEEIKDAKGNRGEASSEINEFWDNSKEDVVENTVK